MADADRGEPSGKLDLSWRERTRRGSSMSIAARGFFSNYFSVSPGMLSQIPGKGVLVIVFTDSDGIPLTVDELQADLPKTCGANFWSVTLYEAKTRPASPTASPSLVRIARQAVQNADGSTDLYLGLKPRRARRRTGSPRCPEKPTSRFCASTGRPTGAHEDLETRRRSEDEVTSGPPYHKLEINRGCHS